MQAVSETVWPIQLGMGSTGGSSYNSLRLRSGKTLGNRFTPCISPIFLLGKHSGYLLLPTPLMSLCVCLQS